MADFTMRAGIPHTISFQCKGEDGNPIDLTGKTLTLKLWQIGGQSAPLSRAAVLGQAQAGWVSYTLGSDQNDFGVLVGGSKWKLWWEIGANGGSYPIDRFLILEVFASP